MGRTVADWHKKYFNYVFRRCESILRNREDAEDAAQEVFLKLIKAEGRGMDLIKIEKEKKDAALLWVNATRVCFTRLKERPKETLPLFDDPPEKIDAFERLDAKLLLESILENESEETKLYCYMYFYDRMKYREISKTVGKSISLIPKKIKAFIKKTRPKLEGTMK
ncbi:hypothetical protein R84B8_01114 [Treponema sp. R8-4-B8]